MITEVPSTERQGRNTGLHLRQGRRRAGGQPLVHRSAPGWEEQHPQVGHRDLQSDIQHVGRSDPDRRCGARADQPGDRTGRQPLVQRVGADQYGSHVLGDRRDRSGENARLAEFPVPKPAGGSTPQPYTLTAGPDGTIWFTDRANGRSGSTSPPPGRSRHCRFASRPIPRRLPMGLPRAPMATLVYRRTDASGGLSTIGVVTLDTNLAVAAQPPSFCRHGQSVQRDPGGRLQ